MKKRALALLMTATMSLSMVSMPAFAAGFSDMPNDWSTPALEKAVSNGIFKGDDNGKIRPTDSLTRAEMATVVNKAFNAQKTSAIGNFADVKQGDWFYTEMSKAVAMKTFVGTGNKLNPRNNITREEVFVILARAFNIPKSNNNSLNQFVDQNNVSSWAGEEVEALVSEGYVDGSYGYLNPGDEITRAEFAQMMDNLVKTYLGAGLYSKDYNGNVVINEANALLQGSTIKGDLIIGDGVGTGKTVLEDVKVTGRLIVRSGYVEVLGNSNIKDVIVGHDYVTLKGKFDQVTLAASDTTLTVEDANIKSIVVSGTENEINVNRNSKVNEIVANGSGLKINSMGTVDKVTAGKEATGVMLNGKEVKPGTTSEDKDEDAIVTYINASGTRLELDGKVYELNLDTRLFDEKGNTLAIGNVDIASNLVKNDIVKDIKVTNGVVTSLVKVDISESNKVNAATVAVVKAEDSKLQTDIDAAQVLVNGLASGTAKINLQVRINAIEVPEVPETALEKATTAVAKAELSKLDTDVEAAQALVNALPGGSERVALQNKINVINLGTVIVDTGVRANGKVTIQGVDEVVAVDATNATIKLYTANELEFIAKDAGKAGNKITMEIVQETEESKDLEIVTNGNNIKVKLATDAAGTAKVISRKDLVSAINADEKANKLITAIGTSTDAVVAHARVALAGGRDKVNAIEAVAEVYTLKVTNGVTENGKIQLVNTESTGTEGINGRLNVSVNVIKGMTPELVAKAINEAMTDKDVTLEGNDYTISVARNVITFTADDKEAKTQTLDIKVKQK